MQDQHPYYFDNGDDREIDQQLRRNIQKAINYQFKAISYYTQLAELAPNETAKQAILGIRQDEIRHFNAFSQTYLQLNNLYPSLQLVSSLDLPSNYRQAIRESIKDESESVTFYVSISNQLTEPRSQRRFMRAAYDEQRHADILRNL
ncbi:ferritin-like domain-containing protein [Bacillus sp. BHET2]|uniref:ferritin family protein n=1 Tax=Bacillus sp. BHET2 TaxID=2583818 RepID=UPI00110D8784|nr:ferritin-like domain-containing protein [Bacillus sp. BHET2]TMU88344.1 ferritin-like domain-containing protein [Bacillus sp. BHET2]